MRPSERDVERGVAIVSGVPRCLFDGAIMADEASAGWDGGMPIPVYDFDCPVCGAQGRIE